MVSVYRLKSDVTYIKEELTCTCIVKIPRLRSKNIVITTVLEKGHV